MNDISNVEWAKADITAWEPLVHCEKGIHEGGNEIRCR